MNQIELIRYLTSISNMFEGKYIEITRLHDM